MSESGVSLPDSAMAGEIRQLIADVWWTWMSLCLLRDKAGLDSELDNLLGGCRELLVRTALGLTSEEFASGMASARGEHAKLKRTIEALSQRQPRARDAPNRLLSQLWSKAAQIDDERRVGEALRTATSAALQPVVELHNAVKRGEDRVSELRVALEELHSAVERECGAT